MKLTKKILALLLALVIPMALAVPAMALTSYELFARWEQDGYPDDVTGIFYNTETSCLAIVLTDNTEARQKELRETLTDGETLTFFGGEYSHAQLAERAAAIERDMAENGLSGTVTVGWGADGGYGASGKDFRVVIKTEKDAVAALTERYAEYSEMVTVEEAVPAEDTAPTPEQPEKQGLTDWGIIGIAAAVAVVFLVVITVAGNKKRAKKEQQGDIRL